MQLTPPTSLRAALGAAACALLAANGTAHAQADSTAASPRWRLEGATLLYGEQGRTRVVEPNARITRLFDGGQTISAGLSLDAITGASPTGAMPTSTLQTTTSASGRTVTVQQDELPTSTFSDRRFAADTELQSPLGRSLGATLGGSVSREKDYQSLGASGKLSLDLLQRTTTLTAGAGYNHDTIFPATMIHRGLGSGADTLGDGRAAKNVRSGLVGVSQILSRRWMAAITGTRTVEKGYLTDPYKIVSVINPTNGSNVGQLTEKRPSLRTRSDVLLGSVYHFETDVLYSEYRFYWDDWGLRSHTVDLKYRHEMENGNWFEPHVRIYDQSKADFFSYGLPRGATLPAYASSDSRLGPLSSITLGATLGFRLPAAPGEFTVRGEIISQSGNSYPVEAIGVQQNYNLAPPLTIGTLVGTYTIEF